MRKETARQAVALFREHGGVLRTAEAMRLGVHPRTLYRLRDDGVIVRGFLLLYLEALQ